jgi:hypothetical protein
VYIVEDEHWPFTGSAVEKNIFGQLEGDKKSFLLALRSASFKRMAVDAQLKIVFMDADCGMA